MNYCSLVQEESGCIVYRCLLEMADNILLKNHVAFQLAPNWAAGFAEGWLPLLLGN